MSQRQKSGDSGFLAGAAEDEMRRRMWEGCGLCALVGFSSEPSRQEAGYAWTEMERASSVLAECLKPYVWMRSPWNGNRM